MERRDIGQLRQGTVEILRQPLELLRAVDAAVKRNRVPHVAFLDRTAQRDEARKHGGGAVAQLALAKRNKIPFADEFLDLLIAHAYCVNLIVAEDRRIGLDSRFEREQFKRLSVEIGIVHRDNFIRFADVAPLGGCHENAARNFKIAIKQEMRKGAVPVASRLVRFVEDCEVARPARDPCGGREGG